MSYHSAAVAHNRAAQDKQNDTRLNYALGLVRGTNSIAEGNLKRALTEIFVDDDRIARLVSFARELLHSTVEQVGWDEQPGEAPEQQH
jgi:hypothetical protein